MDLKATIAASALASVLAIYPVQAGTLYANLNGWQVERFDPTNDSAGGCLASAAFNNGENIGLMQRADKQWILALGPFKTLREGSDYTVDMQITSPHSNYRHVLTSSIKDRLLIAPVSKDLVNELAADPGVNIWLRYVVPGTLAHGSIRLDNSAEVIRTVVHCREAVQTAVAPVEPAPKPQESSKSSSGTGFFVDSKLILTNNHVIDACGDIFIRYPGHRLASAYVASRDETNDLALLETEMNNLGVAKFATVTRVGQQVATYGFPLSGILSSTGNFSIGNVASLAGIKDDTRALQTSVPIQPGNSGGPLMNMSGSVIGVMEAELRATAMIAATDAVPQGVNFAIQSPIVLNFLNVKGVKPILANDTERLDPTDVAEIAKRFTVQVLCGDAAADPHLGTRPSTNDNSVR
jgi:serine protease Do